MDDSIRNSMKCEVENAISSSVDDSMWNIVRDSVEKVYLRGTVVSATWQMGVRFIKNDVRDSTIDYFENE